MLKMFSRFAITFLILVAFHLLYVALNLVLSPPHEVKASSNISVIKVTKSPIWKFERGTYNAYSWNKRAGKITIMNIY